MTTRISRGAALCALLATTTAIGLTAAQAQTGPNPPPRQDTQSPTGVSYYTGAFSHEERDLSIGGGEFPIGLTLDRSYLSSLDHGLSSFSGISTQGWNNNLNARIGNSIAEIEGFEAPEGQKAFLYSVTIGSRSIGFSGGSTQPTGRFEGPYQPVDPGGDTLKFTGDHFTGHATYTDAGGGTLVFNSLFAANGALAVSTWTAPDGTKLDFTYDQSRLKSVISNRGYALLFEYSAVPGGSSRTKACAVNMATTHVTATSPCPAGAQAVTYSYAANSSTPVLTGATDAMGQTTTYGYDGRGHLNCITLPGQSACRISNSYGLCLPKQDPDAPPQDPPGYRWHEPVLSQTMATGESYSYSFPAVQECPVERTYGVPPTTMTESGGPQTIVTLGNPGVPVSVTDPLGRVTSMEYFGGMPLPGVFTATLGTLTHSEGNAADYSRDGRGNVVEQRLKAKPGSGAADIVTSAGYPAGCTNRKTCNKPEFVVDGRGNRTDYTYSPDHGGVLTETGPAVGGVRPQTRYGYAQRFAWVRTASGGYARAASPVWVPTQTSFCKSGAASGSGCAVPGDEVRTTFDYGPDSGPNTLLLRGTVVDAGGLSLRTCYGYDAQGNRISETRPKAGLAVCP